MFPSRDVVSLWKGGRDFWRSKGAVTTRQIFMQLVLLRRKLHQKLRSVTYWDRSRKFLLLPQALQKVGLDSTLRDNDFIDVFTVAQCNSPPCNLSRNALLDQPIRILIIQCSCSCNATRLNVAKQAARKNCLVSQRLDTAIETRLLQQGAQRKGLETRAGEGLGEVSEEDGGQSCLQVRNTLITRLVQMGSADSSICKLWWQSSKTLIVKVSAMWYNLNFTWVTYFT